MKKPKTKNDRLPTLIEKEVSLKQATNIEEKITILADEKYTSEKT